MAVLDPTPVLRVYARYRHWELSRQDVPEIQQRILLRLVRQSAKTRFGLSHAFDRINNIADYQQRVPLRSYDQFWNEYWRSAFPHLTDVTWPGTIPFFAESSGTTSGTSKHIPVSWAMLRAQRRAAFDLLVHHATARKHTRILAGKNFMLGGSTRLSLLAPGIRSGDISGIAAATIPFWARRFYFPPPSLASIQDWQEKTHRLAARSLMEDIRSIAGTPSWLLLFLNELRALRPHSQEKLIGYYPKLELIAHGGISFEPYRARFSELLADSTAETREVYPASEGFIAVADQEPDKGLRLIADNGIFFEFVPLEELGSACPTRHWLGDVEIDRQYALVLTTCAGLWGYVLGDTVRLVSRNPPRIFITGRTSYSLSAFGEHLIAEEIENAVSAAASAISADVMDYCVGPVYGDFGPGGGYHQFLVEFHEPFDSGLVSQFAHVLDGVLANLNRDYKVHRSGDFSMGAPHILVAPPGAFAAWMKSRGKLGGQNKVPRIVSDAQAFQKIVHDVLSTQR